MFALPEVRWATASVLLLALACALRYATASPDWISALVFALCYAAGGWEPLLAGLQAAREKSLDVDLLMIVAALGAASIGPVLDGGLLIVIFATSGAQEAYATKRTQDSVRALLTLSPDRASRLAADGAEEIVDTAALLVGDIVVVRPGESIGADGLVVDGASDVDQASITGEPLPVFRTAGDEVYAGSLNVRGTLQVRVSRAATDSVVARLVTLVERASATKAHTQLFIERVEQRYSVTVVLATLGVFLLPLALGEPLRPALLRAMTFMIVASPCAVVLATMPPLLSAIATAGRNGVLVKSAVVMEQLGGITRVAFDKTGTLTTGRPRLAHAVLAPGSNLTEDALLCLAASAEVPSEHPLGQAVVSAALERNLALSRADEFDSTPGRGVSARIAGHCVQVGSPALLAAVPAALGQAVRDQVNAIELTGATAVVVVLDGRPAGVLGLVDQIRAGAAPTVASLTAATGSTPALLTGDNARAAAALAAQVGISDIRAGLLPADKVTEVARLRDGGRLLVVGDGVNDAPALAAADVGIAMGRGGSDLALRAADAVLVHDELEALPAVIALSRRAHRAVQQNLVLAGTAIIVLITWDLFGQLPLPLGVAAHEGGTVLVGLNGLRLLRQRHWQVPGHRRSARSRPLPSTKGEPSTRSLPDAPPRGAAAGGVTTTVGR
ncbi:MAG: metal-transporting ATPase [Frankiales bacterium]|nr:metal-transporting ATPase [Frankiales bacterium]